MINAIKKPSEWKPISDLRIINIDISEYGYRKEYVEANKLNEK